MLSILSVNADADADAQCEHTFSFLTKIYKL